MKVYIYTLRPKMKFPVISWLIMWLGRTKFSHMAIGYQSLTKSYKIADARLGSGVSDMLAERFFKKYLVVDYVSMELDCSLYEFMEWLEEQEGKSYPFYQLLAMIPKEIGLTKTNSFGGGLDAIICNELILSMLQRFKGLEFDDSDNYDLAMTWSVSNDY